MTPLTIYIAGPVSNTTDFQERFAAGRLEVATLGHTPVCPLEANPGFENVEETWVAAVKADIRTLLQCDGIYCLRDWHQSRGARIEHFIAGALGMVVLYQPE